jgi:predicted nucleic acid-binding protein
VLHRPRFGLNPDAVAALIDYIDATSQTAASAPLSVRLPDADDEAFLEVAIAGDADYLVTGSLVHFPLEASAGVSVVSPADFIEACRSTQQSL